LDKISKGNPVTKKTISALLAIGTISGICNAFVQSNFFRPYDSALRLPLLKKSERESLWLGDFHVGAQMEYGSRSSGRNWDNKRRNILQLHGDTQSIIQMLKEPVGNAVAKIDDILFQLGLPEDVGNIGKIKLFGDYKEFDINLHGSYKLPVKSFMPGDLLLSLYLPITHKKISGFRYEDLTPTEPGLGLYAGHVEAARKVAEGVATLKEGLSKFGNLDISDWKKTGIGDIALLLEWQNRYRQDKEFLKNVYLRVKGGVSIPSGSQKDEDKAFSMPLGFDGAWGIPLGMGMELDYIHNIRAGIDVDFLILFDKTRMRRLKTHVHQTELLLLNKGEATKEYGLTWQFHLFLQVYHLWRGFSAGSAYQFVKRDDDRLSPKYNDFSFSTVNSANSLKEWVAHNILFKVNYDFFEEEGKNWPIAPQVSLFYKLPIAGKNIIDNHTVGMQLAMNF
jgi:hypothetical protein